MKLVQPCEKKFGLYDINSIKYIYALWYWYASQKLIYSNRLWNTGGKGVEYKMLITVVFTIGKYKWWCNYLII